MHFYQPDGTFIDGLKLARKTPGALVSPSSVLGIFTSYGLQLYFKQQAIEAAATTPRHADETDEAWCGRVTEAADEHSQIARDKGTVFHDWAKGCNRLVVEQGLIAPPCEGMEQQSLAYINWLKYSVEQVLAVEKFVVGAGFAGTLDIAVRLKDGRVAIVDTKTQGLKGKAKFNWYARWAIQLGAYAAAFEKTAAQQVDCLISVAVSSDEPVKLEAYEWPKRPEWYGDLFQCALRLWKEDNNWEQL